MTFDIDITPANGGASASSELSKTDAVLAVIRARPGMDIRQIATATRREDITSKCCSIIGLNLVQDGRATRRKVRGIWHYWPADGSTPEAPQARTVRGLDARGRQVAMEAVTPDWLIAEMRDGSLVLTHKDTSMGFRLDVETVETIRRMG